MPVDVSSCAAAPEHFLKTELPDGTVILKPGRFITRAQEEYDTTPELQTLLSAAMQG